MYASTDTVCCGTCIEPQDGPILQGNHRKRCRSVGIDSRAAIFGLHLLACTMVCASLIVAFVLQQPEEASFPTFTNGM
jgi:hypothetical protein